jgi:hypothetical protein
MNRCCLRICVNCVMMSRRRGQILFSVRWQKNRDILGVGDVKWHVNIDHCQVCTYLSRAVRKPAVADMPSKVKSSRNRPGVAQRVPDFHYIRHMKVVRSSVSRAKICRVRWIILQKNYICTSLGLEIYWSNNLAPWVLFALFRRFRKTVKSHC